jgi:hypothetical protein
MPSESVGHDRRKLLDKAAFLDFVVVVVRRSDTDPGFKVIPRRWVVERSIGWLTRYRRRRVGGHDLPRHGKHPRRRISHPCHFQTDSDAKGERHIESLYSRGLVVLPHGRVSLVEILCRAGP